MTEEQEGYFGVEEVDFDLLLSYVEEVKGGASSQELIDKFLSLDSFKISADDDASISEVEMEIEPTSGGDLVSEELAKIYLSQGLYSQAKEIYTQLFLYYSEKIAYFATQIEKIPDDRSSDEGAE